MEKLKLLSRIQELYSEKKNISLYLRSLSKTDRNTLEDIMISYDFQAGSYTQMYKQSPSEFNLYNACLARTLDGLGKFTSILEVGIGEATTFGPMYQALKKKPSVCHGFDISWSRLKYARKYLKEIGVDNCFLFVGDLFNIPMKDSSVDIVYTSHSVEPNGGREKEALQELYRVANRYLVLLEPAYEFAGESAKKRMESHGYVTKLSASAQELGYEVTDYRLFDVSLNPLNPTGIMIIKKNGHSDIPQPLCCPITKGDIKRINQVYYSKESYLAYPIIDEIPCLAPHNAVLASKFLD